MVLNVQLSLLMNNASVEFVFQFNLIRTLSSAFLWYLFQLVTRVIQRRNAWRVLTMPVYVYQLMDKVVVLRTHARIIVQPLEITPKFVLFNALLVLVRVIQNQLESALYAERRLVIHATQINLESVSFCVFYKQNPVLMYAAQVQVHVQKTKLKCQLAVKSAANRTMEYFAKMIVIVTPDSVFLLLKRTQKDVLLLILTAQPRLVKQKRLINQTQRYALKNQISPVKLKGQMLMTAQVEFAHRQKTIHRLCNVFQQNKLQFVKSVILLNRNALLIRMVLEFACQLTVKPGVQQILARICVFLQKQTFPHVQQNVISLDQTKCRADSTGNIPTCNSLPGDICSPLNSACEFQCLKQLLSNSYRCSTQTVVCSSKQLAKVDESGLGSCAPNNGEVCNLDQDCDSGICLSVILTKVRKCSETTINCDSQIGSACLDGTRVQKDGWTNLLS
ncbi:Hypothetical_protein [Hexamita inflata]|uniref:Hypothetical_protein n=1 Tax=Hexamita inflata TaxID=28002 RepID=A0AA86R1Y4_9EUKA|nr:Hypothetical protein HINF_LOCUS57876 [Hexamita inflata]